MMMMRMMMMKLATKGDLPSIAYPRDAYAYVMQHE
jgi:hypothetical protein